ncbi:uncharacterized protein QC763_0039330 [Podospora pseudopauciseta]|uniref:Uncharacterized protein n=1 Tax=Podospora pseudopauciseta TaxID=2093780 RepID=A0ABR0HQF8_9PEZI|nr:hypothetical protein QC763_0039330 [Podospora pseudopauciseta]
MNLNLSASLNIFKLLAKPSLCLPQATVATFADLPIPLDKAFAGQREKVDIKAVVLDKDDCFAYPEHNEVYDQYKQRFEALRAAYPGRRLLIVSNTSGAQSYDRDGKLAAAVEKATGVVVLPHQTKKPGCGDEIMSYFRKHPETGVTSPSQIAVVGDRLSTDIMLANMMGSWGVWVKDGVVPLSEKSVMPPPSTVGKGGKAWIREEEFLFWKKLVPFTKKRCGDDIENNEEHEWNWVASEMRKRMREKYLKEGEPDRRNYTGLAMFEHYWQSARHRRPTVAAGRFPNRYCNLEANEEQVRERDERLVAIRKKRRDARKAARKAAREAREVCEAEEAAGGSPIRESTESDNIDADMSDDTDETSDNDEEETPEFDEAEAIRKMEESTKIKQESGSEYESDEEDTESDPDAKPRRRKGGKNNRRASINKENRRSGSPEMTPFANNGTMAAKRRERLRAGEEMRRNREMYAMLGRGEGNGGCYGGQEQGQGQMRG